MSDLDLELALRTARLAAERAGEAGMAHWGNRVPFQSKSDGSPVTQGDLDSDRAIVETLREAFPEHTILTEESGTIEGDPRFRWVVDPIDGTKGYSRGGFFWGPLIGLEQDGEVVAGASALPAIGRFYWAARGLGCFGIDPKNGERQLRVSDVHEWSESTINLGGLPRILARNTEGTEQLIRTAETVRCYGDAAACAMLLEGRVEAWIEAGVQIWDLGPFPVLIEEAGGRFSDFEGGRSIASGNGIGSNGHVHDVILRAMGFADARG